jgi:hypothetical protein
MSRNEEMPIVSPLLKFGAYNHIGLDILISRKVEAGHW